MGNTWSTLGAHVCILTVRRMLEHVSLEDNDPSGYQSTVAKAAKDSKKIVSFAIPKRSPDLDVMEYSS